MDRDAKLRPLYLAKILTEETDEEHFLTTAQLIQILEEKYEIKSHRQTIKSDINLLKDFGMDIQELKSTQNKYNLIDRQFDVVELKLLIDAVVSSKFITKAKSEELASKLSNLAGIYKSKELKRNLSCEGQLKSENERIYFIVDTINEAINRNKKISFQYFRYNIRKERKLRNNGEAFILTPLHLIWNGDYYYMLGVFHGEEKLGSFRVDRIARCPEILEEDGVNPPKNFDLNAYLNTTFRMYNSSHSRVELICDNGVMDAIIDRFGIDVKTSVNDNNTFKVVVDLAVSHVFYSWIFGFGGKVLISGPEKVKKEYEDMLSEAIKKISPQNT